MTSRPMTSKASTRCKAKTTSGKPCGAAPGGDGYCYVHSPNRGAERAAARKLGGMMRHTPHSDAARPPAQLETFADARAILAYALAEALEGDNSIARGRLLVAIAQAGIEAWKIGELEDRLAAVEAALKARP
jgi:hypothetical protein